ncbi:MAG: hypothetical protein WCS75_04925 [Sphingomonas sp.]
MVQRKSVVISSIMLIAGFVIGFVLRPVIDPVTPTPTGTVAGLVPTAIAGPRGTQSFAANLDEARKIIAGCRDGSVRGDECSHAEEAVETAESRARTKRFLGSGSH